MKKIVILFISIISLFATPNKEYNILYGSIILGKISDFSTINKGYLIGKPTNGVLNFLISWDNYIIYEESKKPNITGDNKYKKDKHLLLSLVRELSKNRPKHKIIEKKKYRLFISCKDEKCDYQRIDKKNGKITKGFLTFTDDILNVLYDEESTLSFKRLSQG